MIFYILTKKTRVVETTSLSSLKLLYYYNRTWLFSIFTKKTRVLQITFNFTVHCWNSSLKNTPLCYSTLPHNIVTYHCSQILHPHRQPSVITLKGWSGKSPSFFSFEVIIIHSSTRVIIFIIYFHYYSSPRRPSWSSSSSASPYFIYFHYYSSPRPSWSAAATAVAPAGATTTTRITFHLPCTLDVRPTIISTTKYGVQLRLY